MEALSHELKIKRARVHIEALRQVAPPTGNRNPFVREHNTETGRYVVRLAPLHDWSLLVGDALQCIRSSLNHLVYDLTVAHAAGVPIPDKVVEGIEFPIFWTKAPSTGEIQKKIGAIAPSAQTLILGLQPHLVGVDYVKDPLYILNELARIDRHRLVLPGAYVSSPGGTGLGGTFYAESLVAYFGMSTPNAVVLEGIIRPIRPGVPVQVHLTMTGQVVFAEGPCDGEDAVKVLTAIDAYIVKSVFGPLEPLLR